MRRILRGGVLVLALAALLVAALPGCTSSPSGGASGGSGVSDETYNLTYQIQSPLTTPYGRFAQEFADEVRIASGGRLNIEVKAGGELVPVGEMTDAVSKGVIDMACPGSSLDRGTLGTVVILFGGSGFPGGPDPMDYLAWFYTGGGKDVVNSAYQSRFGVEVLGLVGVTGAELFLHSNQKITTVDQLKGLKFRTVGLWAEVLESFGAAVVNVPGGEIYEAAQRGVVDAFEYSSPATNWDMGFHEITKYVGVPGIHSPISTQQVMINKSKWDGMSADLKEILMSAVKAHAMIDYFEFTAQDATALDKYRAYGTEVVTLPDATQQAIAERTRSIIERYKSEDAAFASAYDAQHAFISAWHQARTEMQPTFSLYTD